MGMAALLYADDGTLVSSSADVTVEDNSAQRWGGGVYAGLPLPGCYAGSRVTLDSAIVRLNLAATSVLDGAVSLSPSQITGERILGGSMSFNATRVTGANPLADIGLYLNTSMGFGGTPIFVTGTLARDIVHHGFPP
jgi:hypothetical protein